MSLLSRKLGFVPPTSRSIGIGIIRTSYALPPSPMPRLLPASRARFGLLKRRLLTSAPMPPPPPPPRESHPYGREPYGRSANCDPRRSARRRRCRWWCRRGEWRHRRRHDQRRSATIATRRHRGKDHRKGRGRSPVRKGNALASRGGQARDHGEAAVRPEETAHGAGAGAQGGGGREGGLRGGAGAIAPEDLGGIGVRERMALGVVADDEADELLVGGAHGWAKGGEVWGVGAAC